MSKSKATEKHVTEWGISLCWAQANGLKVPPVSAPEVVPTCPHCAVLRVTGGKP